VKINDIKKLYNARFYLISLISCIFISFSFQNNCFSQENINPLQIEFVKTSDSLKTAELYFNVLKIVNNSSKPQIGEVVFTVPENWNTFSVPSTQTIVNPNDTVWIPLRVSPTADAMGGITYVINATFKTKSKQISANTYLTLPSKVKWEFTTNKTSIYFTENNPVATFKIKLSNKGNTNELIKLNLKLGKLLAFADNKNNESVEYIELPAFKDTIISEAVTSQKSLSFEEKTRYQNNWKESAINVTASTEKTEKSAAITIRKLNSTFINQRAQNSTPLNFDYQVYNLMSSQQPRSNFKLFGSILFPENREIEYMSGVQNIYYNRAANQNFDIDRQLIYTIRYKDKRNRVELGYNVNGGTLHSLNGRGLVGNFKVSNNTKLSYALTQNPFSQSIGGNVGVSTVIKSIALNTDVTHENNSILKYSATSVNLGTGFSFLKNHSLSLQVLGSQSNYNLASGRDTTVLGFSFKTDYSMRYKKFDLRLSAFSSMYNYIRNSGFENIYLDSKYTLNDKVRFSIYGNRQRYATTRYPYNFYSDPNFNNTDYLRLTTSISGGNVIYQVGPNYNGSVRQFVNTVSGYKSEYKTYQPGIWAAATYKLNGYRSITPNITISNLRFYYNTEDPALVNYSLNKNIYYSAGINYYDSHWRVNAYYSSGTVSDLYRSVQIDEQPTLSRSIQLRPSYENYFFNRTVRLSAYMNYAYYMPSGRENISYNIKYDQFIKGGWMMSFSGFIYSNSRITDDLGRVSTKDLNFMVGITKSFNIQQPRLKYYNFKTVFYNDLDGNRQKSDNEPPVSNVLVKIEKNRELSKGQSQIPEVELISDANGQISFENLPQDFYSLSFNPLVNLESLYFLDGATQNYNNDKKRTLYIPLAESYRIKGRIIVIRDPNSSEGKINLNGIRITASSAKGETYSVLTDNFGGYIITVPNAEKFKVTVNNVFGEQFQIDNDETDIQFVQNKTINLDFTFYEKKRGIQFENGTNLYNFSSLTSDSEETTEVKSAQTPQQKTEKTPAKKAEKNLKRNYAIQIGMVNTYTDPTVLKNKYKLKNEVYYTDKDSVYKYYIGSFKSLEDARKEINRLGIKESFAVEIDPATLKKAVPVAKLKVGSTTKTQNKDSLQKVKTYSIATAKQQINNSSTQIKTDTLAPGTYYSIQLDALKSYRDPKYYKDKYELKQAVECVEENGTFKYLTGKYKTEEDARGDIARYGMSGYIIYVEKVK